MNRVDVQFTCDECDLGKRDGIQLANGGAKICAKCIGKMLLHVTADHYEMLKAIIAARRPLNGGKHGRIT